MKTPFDPMLGNVIAWEDVFKLGPDGKRHPNKHEIHLKLKACSTQTGLPLMEKNDPFRRLLTDLLEVAPD